MAELTRRGALLGGASTLGVIGVAAAVAARVAPAATSAPVAASASVAAPVVAAVVETLRRSDFAPGIGRVFTARGGRTSRAVAVRLVDIVDVVGATDPERSFNLIFETTTATHPTEGVYRLSSDETPHRTLMLSPVDRRRDGGTRSFQALVNTAA